MSDLLPGDFTDDETESIQLRLSFVDADISRLTAKVAVAGDRFNKVIYFDSANQKVQESAIDIIISELYSVVVWRDADVPGDIHSVRFDEGGGNFPGGPPPELFAATDLNAYLAALPSYASPASGDSILDWEFWRDPAGISIPPVVDTPPVEGGGPGELPAAYTTAKQEFIDRQDDRLDRAIGSYVMKNLVNSQIVSDAGQVTLLEKRKAFWEGLGFNAG